MRRGALRYAAAAARAPRSTGIVPVTASDASAIHSFIGELSAGNVTGAQLDTFIAMLETVRRTERCDALAYFLRTAAPASEQAATLCACEIVREDLALLQLLKRYERNVDFAASNDFEKRRLARPWAPAVEFLRGVLGIHPPSYKRGDRR